MMEIDDHGKKDFFKNARTDIRGPLEGIRVLEVATTIAGPRFGAVFAKYGADVIRVELSRAPDVTRMIPPMLPDTDPPEGYQHAMLHCDKRSITLDLRQPGARDVFLKIARTADVLVENFKKGALPGWGCGYEDVRAVKPDIIYVSITGFGQYGPYSDRAGYDPGIQAMSGLLWMNAADDASTPTRVPVYISDELAGLHAAIGALAALRYRELTGEGQHLDVSLLDATIDSCTGLHVMAAHGLATPRYGNIVPYAAPTNVYACKDGYVYAGVLLDSHWKILAKVMGKPEAAEDPRYTQLLSRLGHREEVDKMLAEWCAVRTRDEIIAALNDSKLPIAPVLTPQEACADPHVQARGTIERVQQPSGSEIKATAAPVKFSRTPVHYRQAPPTLGAHTDEVLESIGIDEAQRAALREKNII
ncbi:MAG TPA: CaiB/BaiF CoA-transferase family protein [Candidatus Hydrogenedentes bacterium]|nr:CaiB/BaiF CoA-transferase family protein [Candidatus Hydrogenedentota bacterium]